jgi:hypothetical protein
MRLHHSRNNVITGISFGTVLHLGRDDSVAARPNADLNGNYAVSQICSDGIETSDDTFRSSFSLLVA